MLFLSFSITTKQKGEEEEEIGCLPEIDWAPGPDRTYSFKR